MRCFYKLKFLFLLFIPCLIAAFLITLFISKRINKSIEKITNRAEGFKKGELYEVFGDGKDNDFPELVDSVNHMGYVMTESIQRMNSDKHRVRSYYRAY